jgi:hypothetical protein
MNVNVIRRPGIPILVFCPGQAVVAGPGFDREARFADEIVDVILDAGFG